MHNNTRSSSMDQSASSIDAAVERPNQNLFLVNPTIDPETLLANAAENLASANEMAATLAFDLDEQKLKIAFNLKHRRRPGR